MIYLSLMIILIKLKIIYKDLFYLIVYVRSITKIINYIVEQKLFIKNNNLFINNNSKKC